MNAILKWFTAGGLPASIAANVLALAHLQQTFAPTTIEWRGLFAMALNMYNSAFLKAFAPIQTLVADHAHVTLPAWSADLMVLYAATAAALTVSGPALATQKGAAQKPASAISGLGWPVAILTFVFNAFRKGAITGFAGRHAGLFTLYIAGVAAAFAGAVYANQALS